MKWIAPFENIGNPGSASEFQIQYTILLAAFSEVMQDDNSSVEGLLDAISEDLEDGKLDKTGQKLIDGLDNCMGAGLVPEALRAAIVALAESGATPTGSLAEAKQMLADLLNLEDPAAIGNKYKELSAYMNTFVADSAEAHMFKAMARTMNLYNSEAVAFVKAAPPNGLGIDFDTDFEKLEGDEVFDRLRDLALDDKVKSILASIETELQAIDADLEKAQGVSFDISVTGLDAVYCDDVDVKIMRAIANAFRAVCIYVRTIDLEIDNWNVTGGDLRDLVKAGTEISTSQWDEALANNPNLFTYSDTAGLENFKAAVAAVQTNLQAAVTALENIGDAKRRNRWNNALGLSTDHDLQVAKILVEEMLPALQRAFNNSAEPLVAIDIEEKGTKYIVEGEYAYRCEVSTLWLNYYRPESGQISVAELFSGSKTPRDVLKDGRDAHDGERDYKPYYLDEGMTEQFKDNVNDTDWEEPVPTFTVPLADITIDGNGDDWADVPVAVKLESTVVKIARDGDGNIYRYSYKSGAEDWGSTQWQWTTTMPDGWWMNQNTIGLSSWSGAFEWAYANGAHESRTPVATQWIDGNKGYEIQYSTKFSEMAKAGSITNQYFYSQNFPEYNKYFERIKLLPEMP